MLRADRYDVPGDIPRGVPFEQVLADCAKRFFHVNTRFGIFDVRQRRFLGMGTGLEANILNFVVGLRILGVARDAPWGDRLRAIAAQAGSLLGATAMRAGQTLTRYVRNVVPLQRLPIRAFYLGRRLVVGVGRQAGRAVRLVIGLATYLGGLVGVRTSAASLRYQRSRWLHTWACGDFTVLARDDWFRLRGYPEWAMYSWHIDSALMYAANAHGIKEITLDTGYRIYHIDHSAGSGWSPDGGAQLFARLSARGVPFLSDQELQRWQMQVAERPTSAIVNGPQWGLADRDLPQRDIHPRPAQVAGDGTIAAHAGVAR